MTFTCPVGRRWLVTSNRIFEHTMSNSAETTPPGHHPSWMVLWILCWLNTQHRPARSIKITQMGIEQDADKIKTSYGRQRATQLWNLSNMAHNLPWKPLEITNDQTQQVDWSCKVINLCLGDAHEKLSKNTDNHLLWFPLDHKCFLPYYKQIIHWLPYQSMLFWINQTNNPEIKGQNVGLL
jgi:hypothetical protein